MGVFLAFTLSQAGMVVHWWRERGQAAGMLKAVVNGVGALATAVTLVDRRRQQVRRGAWITIVLIPLLVLGFLQIRAHYREVAEQLSMRGLPPSLKPFPRPRVVVPDLRRAPRHGRCHRLMPARSRTT